MRAPSFWWQAQPTLTAQMLRPLGLVYGTATALRMRREGYRTRARVICVGNLTAGGAGKTPVAIAVAGLLKCQLRTAFLSRGYGGSEHGPVLVDGALHPASLVGDEPLLLSRFSPTVVSRNRHAGAKLCDEMGIDAIIMDDGLQNPFVEKTLSIAVIDAAIGIGNGLCIPAGPLRASLGWQAPFIDALVLLGDGRAGDAAADAARAHGVTVQHRARLKLSEAAVLGLEGSPVLAFAGIGRPQKFFASLREAGVAIAGEVAFADHHSLTETEAHTLLKRAETERLTLATTEKDFVRFQGAAAGSALHALQETVRAVPVSVSFEDEQAFQHLILPAGPSAASGG